MNKYFLKYLLIFFLNFYAVHPISIITLPTLLEKHPEISYCKIYDKIGIKTPSFEVVPSFPNQCILEELFILKIPNGVVQGLNGHIVIDNCLIKELIWGKLDQLIMLPKELENNTKKILEVNGKVAVIAQVGTGNYGHWIQEVLGRLAILEISKIEYDYLYVPTHEQSFIKKLLELWGINPLKIISPNDDLSTLKATELIVPSLVINSNLDHKKSGNFIHPITMQYTRNKLLNNAFKNLKHIDFSKFNKKIFISRADTKLKRKIMNENDVLKICEKEGFKKYILSDYSIEEQILLFHNADFIIGEHGAGLSNILFCKKNTKIIELFHYFIAMDFWYSSLIFGLDYHPINLLDIDGNFFSQSLNDRKKLAYCWSASPIIPEKGLFKIQNLLESLTQN